LTLLCIFTAAALSVSSVVMCKFTAEADISADAMVAKWTISLTSPVPASNGIIKLHSGSTSRAATGTVTITNGSQVAATPVLTPTKTSDGTQGGVSVSNVTVTLSPVSGTSVIPPNSSKDFNMTVATSASADGYVQLHLTFVVNQVD